MEEVYEALLTIPLDELKPLQREFLALIPKIEGRTDYLNARNSLIYRNLLLEQNNLLNTALSVNPGASVGNAGNMMNATHVIAAGALLTNQVFETLERMLKIFLKDLVLMNRKDYFNRTPHPDPLRYPVLAQGL